MEFKIKKNHLLITACTILLFVSIVVVSKSNLLAVAGSEDNDSLLAKNGRVLAAKKSSYDLIEPSPVAENYIVPDTQSPHNEITIAHTVQKGDSLAAIANKYHADPQTIIDYPYNSISDDLTLKTGQVIIVPNGFIDNPPASPIPARGTGQFAWPAAGNISQYASWWHPGAIDIAAEMGTPIKAADNGKVIKVEKASTGYGWHVILDHEDGLTSLYAHMSKINVEVGQNVSKGDLLGSVGSTGRSTGFHLHFEVHKDGKPIDPMTLLPPG